MSISSGNKILASDFATVATTGSYNDLIDKPTIPTSSLPTVTSADNGKILTVINGVWTAFSNGVRVALTGSYSLNTFRFHFL